MRPLFVIALALVTPISALFADQLRDAKPAVPELSAFEPELVALYRDLHEHPELAFEENRTAETLAKRVSALGSK